MGSAGQRVAASTVICGVFVSGGEDGRAQRAAADGLADVRPEVHVRTENHPENGDPSHARPQLASSLCYSL